MLPSSSILSAIEIDAIREQSRLAILPLSAASAADRFAIGTSRTKAGQNLPPYYLVYFLLVELLRFPHSGRGEKVAWTIPVEFDGHPAVIEYRKLGLGIFANAAPESEGLSADIVKAVERGVDVAKPFFDHLAADAVRDSKLNVKNNSPWLFSRYEYLRDQFRQTLKDATDYSSKGNLTKAITLKQQAEWLGIAAIDAFFSWTEHVFVLLAVLQGRLKTGEQVAGFVRGEWSEKFKTVVRLDDAELKTLYDELLSIKRQIRNYMAHGAFGKQGEAFQFHSAAGAVPVNLTDLKGEDRFSISIGPALEEARAIGTIESFISKFWDGARAPARQYLQETALPLILTYSADGTYERAMSSAETMEWFIEGLIHDMDDAANMDW